MTEEQKNKCEEIINSYEEKYNEWIKEMDKKIDRKNYRVPIGNLDKYEAELTWINGREIIHYIFLHNFQFGNINNLPTFKFLRKHKEKAIEYVIELSVSLAKIFNIDITEEEAKRLFFQRARGFMFNDEIVATSKFSDIVYKKIEYKSDLNMKNIGWAITDFFDKEYKEYYKEYKERMDLRQQAFEQIFYNEKKINNAIKIRMD